MARRLHYQEFAARIDVEQWKIDIGFDPDGVRRTGWEYGKCPDPWGLHANGDTTGKFAIHPEKKACHCWVCGGGDLLSWTMAIFGYSDEDALHYLYKLTFESEKTDESFLAEIDDILAVVAAEKRVMPHFNDRVLDKWKSDWPTKWSTDIFLWFEQRGISKAIRDSYRLGYGQVLKRAPRKADGTAVDEDYIGPAVIFPHFWYEKLVGWQYRWLDEDRPKWLQKYTNTTGFPREDTIFNFNAASRFNEAPIVVESVPTALFLQSYDIASVATFGATPTDRQIRVLRRFQHGIILSPDNDGAGVRWANQLRHALERYIPIYELPPYGDEKGDLGDMPKRAGGHDVTHELLNWLDRAH